MALGRGRRNRPEPRAALGILAEGGGELERFISGLGPVAADATAALVVPLAFRGSAWGCWSRSTAPSEDRRFTAEDKRLLSASASVAAAALATAQGLEPERLRRSAGAQSHGAGAGRPDDRLQGLA